MCEFETYEPFRDVVLCIIVRLVHITEYWPVVGRFKERSPSSTSSDSAEDSWRQNCRNLPSIATFPRNKPR